MNTKNNFFNRLSTISVFVSIIILIIFQYHWVISSAEKDLSELYRNYTFRIFSDISDNFSMLSTQGERLDNFKKIESEKEFQETFVSKFNKLNSIYNNKYFKSISYIKKSGTDKSYIFYSSNSWEYNKSIPVELVNEIKGPSLVPDASDKDSVWIIFPGIQINNNRITIIYNFDILSFYRNRVEKSLSIINDNYNLKWYYNQTVENAVIWKNNYSYSPFRVLKNKIFSIDSPNLIEVPIHILMFNNKEKRTEKLLFEHRKDNSINNPFPSVYVDILYNGKTIMQSKEYMLTIQWLMSLLLLIGIATAYFVILYQINKLKKLRIREKEFVASVTHELRTPLTVIHSAADNIKSGIILPERLEQYGNMISNQSDRLSSMIEGILLFSRLEGKAEKSPQQKTLKISDISKNLKMYTQSIMNETGNILKIDFGSLPDKLISDRETIELILTNLITNSCKHAYKRNEPGSIRVRGHIQLPHSIIFTVEDDGCGIKKSEIKHIFEPFFRGNNSLNEQITGSGLGLFLSKKKADLIGASLKVKSPYERLDERIREGSCFILKIPYYKTEEE